MPDWWAREVESIVERIAVTNETQARFVIAIAGPPAAGKSTFAEALKVRLEPRAVVLGMDAFHFDDAILVERGDRDRKGAPHTFDPAAYRHTLDMIKNERSRDVSIPVFDRSMELSRNCAEIVRTTHDVVITEGNYLLSDAELWRPAQELFDLTVMVGASDAEIERRILERWRSLGHAEDEAAAKARHNDIPNARYVRERSIEADVDVLS